ncbi:MAG: helix-turn-helix domain-containing protein [Ruminococcaceae bacterium]|nr:helix-turn-helix domain-containing protein [Oscillospiraceae bacterium]
MATTFGKRLQELRNSKKMTQADLGRVLKISASTIGMYETDKRQPNFEIEEAIADFFNVDLDYLRGKQDNPLQNMLSLSDIYPKNTSGFVKVPILGRVAAGVPIMAQEDVLGWEDVPADWAKNDVIFALKLKGDSMEPKMEEGDIVICRQQTDVDHGDIAVVMVNGDEATCKKISKSPDGITLISNNPKYLPMHYTNKDIEQLPVRILGRVIELRAKF